MPFRSVIPALLTPFDDALALDADALGANARALVDVGSADVVVCGTMGEAGALSPDERAVVIETAKDAGARVTVGVSAPDGPTAARHAEQAAALGAHGVMCLPPTVYPADERELDAHFAAEHRLVYEAVLAGDAEAAALYAQRHVQRVHRDITE